MNQGLPRAILFDLDDTILSFSSGAEPCWQAICEKFSPRAEGVSPEELFAAIMESRTLFWQDPERHRRGRLNLDGARREIVGEALSRLGVDSSALAKEIADTYALEREKTLHPFPGAIEALQLLRDRGVRLALLTNGDAHVQRRKVDRFGLAQLFDLVLIEGETGIGKPDERVYLQALQQLGARPEETWMVGNNLVSDVQGAQELGIFGIWVDFGGSGLPKASLVWPDRIIRSVSELVLAQDPALPGVDEREVTGEGV